ALGSTRPVGPVLLAVPGPAGDEHALALLARRLPAGRPGAARGGRSPRSPGGGPGLCAPAAVRPVGRPRPPAATPRRRRWPAPPAGPLADTQPGRGRLALGPGLRGVTAVDPDLDADPAERGAGLVEAVVDVRAQRVQRHPALAVELRAGHL